MSLGEIGRRPLRWMIGMRVIEARNLQPLGPRLALNLHQLHRGNVVAIVRRIRARIARPHGLDNRPGLLHAMAEQGAAALVRIRLFAVSTQAIIDCARHMDRAHRSSQNRSDKYLSAESGSTVTITARRPAAASSRAIFKQATTA